jgi:hypothetical protein
VQIPVFDAQFPRAGGVFCFQHDVYFSFYLGLQYFYQSPNSPSSTVRYLHVL